MLPSPSGREIESVIFIVQEEEEERLEGRAWEDVRWRGIIRVHLERLGRPVRACVSMLDTVRGQLICRDRRSPSPVCWRVYVTERESNHGL